MTYINNNMTFIFTRIRNLVTIFSTFYGLLKCHNPVNMQLLLRDLQVDRRKSTWKVDEISVEKKSFCS